MPPPTIKQDLASWASAHQKIVERIDPKLIISEQSCIGHVGALRLGQLISTEVIENWPAKIDRDAVTVDLDQIAFLQHSSGTTGLKRALPSPIGNCCLNLMLMGGRLASMVQPMSYLGFRSITIWV